MHPVPRITCPVALTGLLQRMKSTGWLLLSMMVGSPLLAQPALVKDINLKGFDYRAPEGLTDVNGTVFFTAFDAVHGRELWKSDGTPAGTRMVKDIRSGTRDSNIGFLTAVNGTLFFSAYTEPWGQELWKSDGTPEGTVMVKDIYPGQDGASGPLYLTNVNGTLFFGTDAIHGPELWKSDGTEAGTVSVGAGNPGDLTNVNGTLFYTATTEKEGTELWKSDGTPAGTVMVRDVFPGPESSSAYQLTNVNGTLFFTANDGTHGPALWKSDGTPAGTVMVKDIFPGSDDHLPFYLTDVDGTLFFMADNGTRGDELWKSDGTPAGTVMVKDIYPGEMSSGPKDLTNLDGVLFFSATNGTRGSELWKSDGTSQGTVMVRDLFSGTGSAIDPYARAYFTQADGTLFFAADDGTHGRELWKSDGTSEGTMLVKDIKPGETSSDLQQFVVSNGTLFFTADDGTHGFELWKSNGTGAAGAAMVKDINPVSAGSAPAELRNVNGTLFFTADDGSHGFELWKSDGTRAGTVMLKDIYPGPEGSLTPKDPYDSNVYTTDVNGTFFFTAEDSTHGFELWKSDGTREGTVMVREINPGANRFSGPRYLTNVNGTLFFAADDGTHGLELWKSDGTSEGTVMVRDIYPNPNGSVGRFPYYTFFANVNGTLFFTATNGTSGYELWKSDGTPAGTVMVKDINPGSQSSTPFQLTHVNGTLFFRANNGTNGTELWKSDGTPAGTVLVKDINPGSEGFFLTDPLFEFNGTLFLSIDNGTNGYELWKSDGTPAGTVMVKDVNPGPQGSGIGDYTTVNGTLFFRAFSEKNGNELWKSDGTGEGTVMVKDIRPDGQSSTPHFLTNLNGTLFFSAYDGTSSNTLWKSDGTRAGTVMVQEIHPGTEVYNPAALTNVNGTLFFTADDGLRGQELWKYTQGAAPAPRAFRINAGGEAYTDGEGQAFIADRYANSGRRSAKVTAEIASTAEDALYQQGRVGERFTYSLPTGAGVYYVVLHFAETYWGNQVPGGAGSRRFNVDIEELRKLTDYDIYAKAGGSLSAVQEAFRVVVKDSLLQIRFSEGTADLPLISAIEVFEEDAFRINVAGSAYLSGNGWFLSDFYGAGGSASAYAPGAVAGTQDDELYRSNRHSALFHYNLPTGPGQFQVTLHFNETYWGNLAPGGAGSRRFNVNAEGERKLSGYDTYQKAGGAMRARQEQFSVTVTDQVLSLAFLRGSADHSVDFAHVAAIEVVKAAAPAARLRRPGDQAPESSAAALYPNPVHATLTVRLSFPVGEIRATAIRDATGRTLLVNTHKPIGEQQFQVDVASLPEGGYLLQVQTAQGEQVLRFVKQ